MAPGQVINLYWNDALHKFNAVQDVGLKFEKIPDTTYGIQIKYTEGGRLRGSYGTHSYGWDTSDTGEWNDFMNFLFYVISNIKLYSGIDDSEWEKYTKKMDKALVIMALIQVLCTGRNSHNNKSIKDAINLKDFNAFAVVGGEGNGFKLFNNKDVLISAMNQFQVGQKGIAFGNESDQASTFTQFLINKQQSLNYDADALEKWKKSKIALASQINLQAGDNFYDFVVKGGSGVKKSSQRSLLNEMLVSKTDKVKSGRKKLKTLESNSMPQDVWNRLSKIYWFLGKRKEILVFIDPTVFYSEL